MGMNDILLEQRFWFRYFDYETFTKHSIIEFLWDKMTWMYNTLHQYTPCNVAKQNRHSQNK